MNATEARFNRVRGFTLIELMIVITIVGLLSSLAYPSFTEYVVRAKRQTAQEALYRITSQQEQFFADNKTYARNLQDLGFDNDLMAIDDEGQIVPFGTSDKNYGLTMIWVGAATAAGTTLTYAVYAWPYGAQYTRDIKCGSMWLDEGGQRWTYGSAGTDDCW